MKCMTYVDLMEIMGKPDSAMYIQEMRDNNALNKHLPEIAVLDEYMHNPKHHPEGCDGDNYGTALDHVIAAMHIADELMLEPVIKLCVLFHDIGKGVTGGNYDRITHPYHNFYGHEKLGLSVMHNVFKRIVMPDDIQDKILFCIKYHMNVHRIKEMRIFKVKKFVTHDYWPILKQVSICDDMSRSPAFNLEELRDSLNYAEQIRNSE